MEASGGDVIIVSLSCPAFAAVPRMQPSRTPGLSFSSCVLSHAAVIFSASSRNRRQSIPQIAAGTMPKTDKTEKRPPISASPLKTRINPSVPASVSRLVPGSVMAIKRPAAFSVPSTSARRCKKKAMRILGSSELPDLLATMNTVCAGSIAESTALIWAGSVESSTISSG